MPANSDTDAIDGPSCQVCGAPGQVMAAPSGPYSGCWCPKHAPAPKSPLLTILNTTLLLTIVVVVFIKACS